MLKVKAGDLEKLGLLFERYNRILLAFFYRMNFDQEVSEDLVQNVFMRIIKYRQTFHGRGEFKTWMFHIARNVNKDQFRKKRIVSTQAGEDTIDQWTDYSEQQEKESEREHMRIIEHALMRLDPEKREILTMSKLEGMKYRDIGKVLKCSEGAVKVKVFRAMKDLKEEVSSIEKNEDYG